MTTVARRGEPPGLVGWTADPRPLSPKNLRLYLVCNARGQSQLNLSHRELTHIPQQVFHFQELEVLKLSHNHLDVLPVMISYLRGLRTLHLQHNLLVTLPETLINCRHLADLDLTHNRLTSLPRGLAGLKQLRVLKLGENQLEQVPHEIGALSNLRVLDLHGNKLWYFPFSVQNLYHLLRLDLSNNLYDQVPLVLTKMPWLRALNMSHNRLAALPPDFDQMRGLRELNLSDNRFVALGIMTTKLRHLKYLSLSHNRLQFLPDQTSRLQELRVLHLQDNCLESIPDNFKSLKYLNVADNKLKYFSVRKMEQLVALDVSGNQMEAVPHGTYRLKHLRRLNLARNAITELTEDIGWLKNLQTLNVSENDLRSLPAALHFMNKLASFNVRGNHKISRAPIPSTTQDVHDTDKPESVPHRKKSLHKQQTDKRQKTGDRDKLHRPYSSMPSLNHDAASHPDPSVNMPKDRKASDWLASHEATSVDKSWLDIFRRRRTSRPQRRASWDDNAMLRTATSIPYPLDLQYSTAEMRADFFPESESDDDDKFGVHDPYAVMSFHSNGSDSALEASFSSQDDVHTSRAMTHDDDKIKLLTPTPVTTLQERIHDGASHTNKTIASSMADRYPGWDQTERKTPFTSSRATTHSAGRDKTLRKLTQSVTASGHDLTMPSQSHMSEPRDMHYLYTHTPSVRSSSRSKKRGKSTPSSLKMKSTATQFSEKDRTWMLQSHLAEPLTVQTWTQTDEDQVNVHMWTQPHEPEAIHVNVHSKPGSSSASVHHKPGSASLNVHSKPGSASLNVHSKPGSVYSPTDVGSHVGVVSTSCDNFIMKKQPTLEPTFSQPSGGSSFFLPPNTESGDADSSINPISQLSSDLTRGRTEAKGSKPDPVTDYTLLGVCNQIQTLLHKDLLQPVIGFNGNHTGRFSNKVITRSQDGLWHYSQTGSNVKVKDKSVWAGLEYSPGETFTATEQGGHYMSAFCPHVQVSVPPGATERTLHVTLQQLTIAPAVLQSVCRIDSYVSNIISIGPIVFLQSLEKVNFTSPVTLTIPAPHRVKGHQGHLVVVSVRPDNTCVPCSTGYQSSRREVTLTTWHMVGKVAVLTKAKCKYKACKSVEQLLSTLNIITSQTTHYN